MLKLRKIPLGPFIEMLQDLWENGADFIDLSGEQSEDNSPTSRDMIQITVKPEYLSNEEEDSDVIELIQEVELDYSNDDIPSTIRKTLSDDDINELI
jgi:dihydropteroate synthase